MKGAWNRQHWTEDSIMTGTKSIVGVLSIMMASGTIADFDVFELDSEVHIRVWSAGGRDDNHLHKQVAAILPPRGKH
jgi:hypothetical protein